MQYTSNLNTVIDQLNVKLKNISDTSDIEQTIAVSLATSNTNRIHNQSKDVSGAKITYKRARKTPKKGAYSKSWASSRSKAGRQTSRVDFFMSGKLSKEFQAAPITGGWGVGWIGLYGSEISKELEDGFGTVWGVTQADQNAINEIVTKEINKELR